MSDGSGNTATSKLYHENKVTCYSDGEGRFMQWSQELRGRWMNPLLSYLAKNGVNADHITILSLLSGLAFCPMFLWGSKTLALILLGLHVVLDGIDGPLARLRGQASNRGSFTDTMADQAVVAVSTLTMIHAGFAGAWPGGLYFFLYTVVVAFAMARNAMAAPYSWLFRPRFFVFAWFAIEVNAFPGTLDLVLSIASGILALKCLTGFLAIRRQM